MYNHLPPSQIAYQEVEGEILPPETDFGAVDTSVQTAPDEESDTYEGYVPDSETAPEVWSVDLADRKEGLLLALTALGQARRNEGLLYQGSDSTAAITHAARHRRTTGGALRHVEAHAKEFRDDALGNFARAWGSDASDPEVQQSFREFEGRFFPERFAAKAVAQQYAHSRRSVQKKWREASSIQ